MNVSAGLSTRERAAEERARPRRRRPCPAGRAGHPRVRQRQEEHLPVHQRHARQRDAIGDALAVDHLLREVDVPHALDEDVEHRHRVLGARQFDRLLAEPAVERADVLAVHEDQRVVVQVGDLQPAALAAHERRPVEHQALVLPVGLEGLRLDRLHRPPAGCPRARRGPPSGSRAPPASGSGREWAAAGRRPRARRRSSRAARGTSASRAPAR